MLNISIASQIKSSTDNSIPLIGSGGMKESATEDFGKVLEREVSETANKETTNKRETSSASTTTESSENTALSENSETSSTTVATAITTPDTSNVNSIIHNLFMDATHKTDQSLLSFDLAPNPDMMAAMVSVVPVTSSTSTLFQNPLIPQDSEQTLGSTLLPANQMLPQRSAQTIVAASNFVYSPNDFWQSWDQADSAAYGKSLPFSSELSETIAINMGESTFSTFDQSISTQSSGLSSATSTASLNTALQDIHVDLPVGQPKWGGEFAQKIVWMANQQNQVAEIRLNPAHLGPVEVMLSITQDQATAQFSSPHLAVREAIEAALPRLKEMMAENGIQLGNVMVGADSFQQENKQQQAHNLARDTIGLIDTNTGTEIVGEIETTVLPNRHNGIVNTYA